MADDRRVHLPLRSPRRHRGLVFLVVLSMLAPAAVLSNREAGAAARAFGASRFSLTAPGDIDYVANTLLTCPASANCTGAQNGTRASANNEFSMIYVDTDGVGSTFNSSSALLDMPAGSTVEWAGLYWGAVSTAADRDEVLFDVGAGYQTVTATQLDTIGSTYQAFADVTALVAPVGNGTYTVGDVQARTGSGRHAGWSLVVAFRNPTEPWRNLTVFDGFERVNQSSPVDITVSGFLAPPVGPVTANIGVIAYEGDNRYTGDYAEFEGVRLGDGLNPTGNFFNAAITTGGVANPGGSPSYVDQLGFDAKIIETVGRVAPGSTSADVALRSAGDWYYAGVVTTAIEVYLPDLTADFDKSVTDVNGGDAHTGDVLEYELSFSNQGDDPAIDVVITDTIPANTTLVPGSIEIVVGDNVGVLTDGAGDDQGEEAGGVVTVRLGTGADQTDGGRIDPFALTGQRYVVRFQVTVDGATPTGTVIENAAEISYTAFTTRDDITQPSPSVETPIVALTDIELVDKQDTVDPVRAGNAMTWILTVGNNGPSPADDVLITDVLPAGVTFDAGTSSASCSEGPVGTVTCDLGTVPVGLSNVTIGATVDADTPAGSMTNAATITTSTDESDPDNNAANELTTVQRLTDLSFFKTATPDPVVGGDGVPGEFIDYQLEAVNYGPSTATNTTIVDPLTPGVTAVTATATNGGTCTITPAVECSWPTLPVGISYFVDVRAAVDAGFDDGDSVTNQASISADEPDNPAGQVNTASTTVDLVRRIDLAVTKSHLDPVVAGATTRWDLEVSNNGPSDATGVTLTDTLPSGATFLGAESTAGCVEAPVGTITCPIGDLAAGTSVDIVISVAVDADLVSGSSFDNDASVTGTETEDPGDLADNTTTDPATIVRSADLAITKDHVAEPVLAGGAISWVIDVVNNGPSDAAGVTVVDTLPSGVTFSSATAGCTEGPVGTVTCVIGALADGAATSVTINGTVDAGTADGAVLVNGASVSSSEPDPVSANDTTSSSTQVERSVLLELFKREAAGSSDPALAGTAHSWEIELINRGPSIETNVVVTDDLSALPVTVTGVSGPGCSLVSDVVTCSIATLAVDDPQIITVDVVFDSDLGAGTMVTNTADAIGDAAPSVAASEGTTITTAADLDLTKSGPATLLAGELATYVVELTNLGPSDATAVTIDDLLPVGLTADAVRVITGSASCTIGAGTVSCTTPSLTTGSVIRLELDARADTSMTIGTIAVNQAVTDSAVDDPDTSNNTANATTTIGREADLAIEKTGPAEGIAGDTLVYELEVTNNGPSDATSTIITDDVPTGTTFAPLFSDAACTEAAGTITCDLGTLDPDDGPVTVSVALTVDPTFVAGPLVNTADVAASETDPVAGNDTDDHTTTITTAADLSLVKRTPPAPAIAGSTITYTFDVANTGPSDAIDVTVTDPLPTGTSFVGSSLGPACTEALGTISCDLGTIPDGGSTSFTVELGIDPSLTGEIENIASVSATTTDPDPGNNTGTDRSPLSPRADLRLDKTATPDPVIAGQNVAFTLTATNDGPSTATSVVVTDALPSTLTFVAAASDTRCVDAGGGTIECTLTDPVLPGTSVELVITAGTASDIDAGLQITNNALITADTLDPDEGNNDARVDVDVDRVADLQLTKSADPTTAIAGDVVAFTLTATNNGPSAASLVTIDDTLPASMTLVDAVPGPGLSCATTSTTASCAGAELLAGATASVVITARVDAATPDGANLVNTASVRATETDPVPGNDGATAAVAVARQTDLSLEKTAAAQPLGTAGESQPFELRVSNVGLSDASGVVITDPIPTGATFDPDNSAAVCVPAGGNIECTIGALAAGAEAAVVVSFILDDDLLDGSDVTNTATVTGNEPDADPSNDESTAVVPVQRIVDLLVRKQGSADPRVAGGTTTFTFEVANQGPSVATAVVVSDTLPTGMTFDPGASDGRCSALGQVVTCTLGNAPVADPIDSFTIGVDLDPGLTEGALLTNTATVEGAEPDRDNGNDTSSAITQITKSTELELVKRDLADPVLAGETLSYELALANLGPSTSTNATVTDTVPAGLTVTALDPRCTEVAGLITCAAGTLAPAAGTTFRLDFAVDSDLATGTQITNTANASDNEGATATSAEITTIERAADVSVTKTASTDDVVAGDPVDYDLTIVNNGPSDASEVVLNELLPPGATVATIDAGTGECAESAGLIQCRWETLADGAAAIVRVSVVADPDLAPGADFVNAASVSAAEPDPDTDNNDGETNGSIQRAANLSLDKTAVTPLVEAGAIATWTLTASNAGPSFAAGVEIVDTLPDGVLYLGDSSSSECTAVDQTVTCVLGDLADGAEREVTIAVAVPADLADGAELVNTAIVTTLDPNPNPDPTATSTVTVATGADLSVEKTTVSAPSAGETATYEISVRNDGPSDAQTVVISDELPDGLSLDAADAPIGCTVDDDTVTCVVGTLPVGDTRTFTLLTDVAPDAEGTLANTATATSPTSDPDPASNTATVTDPVTRNADLAVAKVVETGATSVRQVWTLEVRNNGPASARAVVIDDILPGNLEVTAAPVFCTNGADGLSCEIPEIAPGTTAAVVVETSAAVNGPTTLENAARVSGADADPTTTNDSAIATITVSSPPSDLAVTGRQLGLAMAFAVALIGIGVMFMASARPLRTNDSGRVIS